MRFGAVLLSEVRTAYCWMQKSAFWDAERQIGTQKVRARKYYQQLRVILPLG